MMRFGCAPEAKWAARLALTAALSAVLGATLAPAQAITFNGFGTVTLGYVVEPMGVAVDSAGDVYVTDTADSLVMKVTAAGVASVLNTGSLTAGSSTNCSGTPLCGPVGVAVDSAGDVYIADSWNNRIVEVTAAGVASVLSTGSLTPPNPGCTALCGPKDVAVDGSGDVFIVDSGNQRVVEVTAAGVVSVLNVGSPGGEGLNSPSGIAVDGGGDVYIADTDNNRVVEVTAAGVVSVLSTGSLSLSRPQGIAVDGAGDVYIADTDNNRVVEVTAAGVASVMGTGSLTAPSGSPCTTALCAPYAVAVDGTGDVYVADDGNWRVVEVSPTVNFGAVPVVSSTTTASQQTLTYTFNSDDTLTAVNVLTQGASGKDYKNDPSTTCVTGVEFGPDGAANTCSVVVDLSPAVPGERMGAVQLVDANGVQATTSLRAVGQGPMAAFQPGIGSVLNTGSPGGLGLNNPSGVAVDGAGDVYIADEINNRVVEVTAAGAASVLNIGSLSGRSMVFPFSAAVDGAGNLYIVDMGNSRVVVVTPAGVASVLNVSGVGYLTPYAVAVDGAGVVYITDYYGSRVVEVTPAGVASVLNTGNIAAGNASFCPTSVLCFPEGIAVDSAGDVYIADTISDRVVEVTAAGVASVLSTGSLANTPNCGGTTVLCFPIGVAVDGAGDVYIADSANRVVEVTPAGVASVLNSGSPGGEDLSAPSGVAVDGAGDLYIADTANNRIAVINQAQTAALGFATANDGTGSAEQDVSVQNIGNMALDITALGTTTTGQTASSFNLNGLGTTCTSSTSLTPGESCGLGVEFDPLASGMLIGTVNITDNNLNAASPADTLQQIGANGVGIGYAATMRLTESATSVAYGTPVTLTATLSGLNGIPAGSVSYSVDGVTLGSIALTVGASSSTAQFTLPGTIDANTHGVLVSYAGNADYYVSTSEGFTLTVTATRTTTGLSAPASAIAGSSVNLTATVLTGTTPITSGLVTFSSTNSNGTISLGAAQLGSGGTAMLVTTALPVGSDGVTASFAGSTDYSASTSSSSTVNVSAAIAPSYKITANPATLSIAQGQTGTTTLTFTPAGGYSGTLTLSCGNLPSFVICLFAQNGVASSTVTMNGNGQAVTATLTIDTNSSTARLQAEPAMRRGFPGRGESQAPASTILLGMILGWPGLGGLATAISKRRKGNKRGARLAQLGLLAAMAAAVLVGFSGCGGSGGSSSVTPAGSSTILITATPSSGGSGSLSSQTLSLSVTITQ